MSDNVDELWTMDSVVYLNHAGQSPLTPSAKKAGIDKISGPAWKMDASEDQQRIRQLFASLIEAEESDIAFAPTTAFAITLAARNMARSLSNRTGRILVIQDQYTSAVYPWQQICEESNGDITLDIVPLPPAGTTLTEAVLARLDAGVLVACLPPLHWGNGALIDLELVSKKCQSLGTTLIVDATQAVGIWPVSVKKIQPTFLCCSVHKWLGGPHAASMVYVSPEVRDSWLPLDFHSRNRDRGGVAFDPSNEVMGQNGYEEKFVDNAAKFDAGGKANPILMPMLRHSMERVVKINMMEAQDKLQALLQPLFEWAELNGYETPRKPHVNHLVSIRPPNKTQDEMMAFVKVLQERGIILAVRCGGFRVSPYLNTTPDDIQKLIKELEAW